jgi:hypothetical protein
MRIELNEEAMLAVAILAMFAAIITLAFQILGVVYL